MTKSVRYYIQPLGDDQAVVRTVPLAVPEAKDRPWAKPAHAPAVEPIPPTAPARPPVGRARVARLVRAAIRRKETPPGR